MARGKKTPPVAGYGTTRAFVPLTSDGRPFGYKDLMRGEPVARWQATDFAGSKPIPSLGDFGTIERAIEVQLCEADIHFLAVYLDAYRRACAISSNAPRSADIEQARDRIVEGATLIMSALDDGAAGTHLRNLLGESANAREAGLCMDEAYAAISRLRCVATAAKLPDPLETELSHFDNLVRVLVSWWWTTFNEKPTASQPSETNPDRESKFVVFVRAALVVSGYPEPVHNAGALSKKVYRALSGMPKAAQDIALENL